MKTLISILCAIIAIVFTVVYFTDVSPRSDALEIVTRLNMPDYPFLEHWEKISKIESRNKDSRKFYEILRDELQQEIKTNPNASHSTQLLLYEVNMKLVFGTL